MCIRDRCYLSDIRNEVFALTLATANSVNQTVGCAPLLEGSGTFECEFCYGSGTSCQDFTTCLAVNNSVTSLPKLTEVAYCYRATARVNGIPVVVVQDTFSTGE